MLLQPGHKDPVVVGLGFEVCIPGRAVAVVVVVRPLPPSLQVNRQVKLQLNE